MNLGSSLLARSSRSWQWLFWPQESVCSGVASSRDSFIEAADQFCAGYDLCSEGERARGAAARDQLDQLRAQQRRLDAGLCRPSFLLLRSSIVEFLFLLHSEGGVGGLQQLIFFKVL